MFLQLLTKFSIEFHKIMKKAHTLKVITLQTSPPPTIKMYTVLSQVNMKFSEIRAHTAHIQGAYLAKCPPTLIHFRIIQRFRNFHLG